MNNLVFIRQVLAFFAYLLGQVIFFKNFDLFNVAFCFLYINFILSLPVYTDRRLLLGLGFVTGFFVDNFYDTLGMHSMSCVLVAYLRPYLILFLSDKTEIYDISIKENGVPKFFQYTATLVFLHHLCLFSLQQFNASLVLDILLKTFSSTIFTTLMIFIIQYLFFSPFLSDARK